MAPGKGIKGKRGRDITNEFRISYAPPPASRSIPEHLKTALPEAVVAIDLGNVLTRMAEYQVEQSSWGGANSDDQNLIKQLEFLNTKWKESQRGVSNVTKGERLKVLRACKRFEELCTSLQKFMEHPLEWMHERGPWKDLNPRQVRAVYVKDSAIFSEKENTLYNGLKERGYEVEVKSQGQKVDPFPAPKTTDQRLDKEEATRLSFSSNLEVAKKPESEDAAASATLAPTSYASSGMGPTPEASRKDENSAASEVSCL